MKGIGCSSLAVTIVQVFPLDSGVEAQVFAFTPISEVQRANLHQTAPCLCNIKAISYQFRVTERGKRVPFSH